MSGYVHAASSHIMDMYGGEPPTFHVRGVPWSGIRAGYADLAVTYCYRGLISTYYGARAVEDIVLADQIYSVIQGHEKALGTNLFPPGR